MQHATFIKTFRLYDLAPFAQISVLLGIENKVERRLYSCRGKGKNEDYSTEVLLGILKADVVRKEVLNVICSPGGKGKFESMDTSSHCLYLIMNH